DPTVKLAHLADLHLGFRQYDRQTPRGGNQREADVADAFRRAVDDLLEQRPNLILVAGDVFHSVRPTNSAILFLFKEVHRLRSGLPDTPIVMIAGNHDTPRSTETGTILRLYEALGVHVVIEAAQYLTFSKLDCSVLAAPHQALAQPERPALRPQRGTTFNVLLVHGQSTRRVSTSTFRRSTGRDSRRTSSMSASPPTSPRRSRRSRARSCGSSSSTYRAPPRGTWTTRRSAGTRPTRCTISSTCVGPR